MLHFRRIAVWLLGLISFLCTSAYAATTPKVVVSIAPVHSLVAAVMKGVAEPVLLVSGAASPHQYRLKPSQMRGLRQADLIVWVDETIEGFMPRVIQALPEDQAVVRLSTIKGMGLRTSRHGGVWQAHEDAHHHGHHHHGHDEEGVDGHVWLDPDNARIFAEHLTQVLSELDGVNQTRYEANRDALVDALAILDKEIREALAPVGKQPFMVFHDAYQYFEKRYGLNAVGAVSVSAQHKPSAKRLRVLRQRLVRENVRCLFKEPQFPDSAVRVITEGRNIRTASLDPMGSALATGAEMYFELMRGLGRDIKSCLTGR